MIKNHQTPQNWLISTYYNYLITNKILIIPEESIKTKNQQRKHITFLLRILSEEKIRVF